MQSIIIFTLLPIEEHIIHSLVTPLESVFRTTVRVDPPQDEVVNAAFDSSRGQFNSTLLIKYLLTQYRMPDTKILGITSVDLFVPVLTYVFGEAQLDGTVGVMSVFRYDETLYGMERNPAVLFERSLKEAVHELGHTFGLLHCRNYECSMHASTTVEDVDTKGVGFCSECRKKAGIGLDH
jgi:archaemetzincin